MALSRQKGQKTYELYSIFSKNRLFLIFKGPHAILTAQRIRIKFCVGFSDENRFHVTNVFN